MGTRPNLTLSATSPDDLHAQLRAIDIAVPLVSEGRTKEHREQYMMARLLATMAKAGQLEFPLDLVHGEKPDFTLSLAGFELGAECVEAVPPEHYHIEDIRERLYPGAMNFGQKFEPGEQNFTSDEKHEIASGERAGPPWMPAAMRRNWVASMEYVIAGKTAKLRKGNYAASATNWLLVQDEWPNALHFYPQKVREAAGELLVRLEPFFSLPAFQSIFIASGNKLLCFQKGQLYVEEICNLWQDGQPINRAKNFRRT